MKRYFSNEKLRIAFSFHPLLIGGNPFSTTAYYCLISHLERLHGVHYAMGGTGALVRGLVSLIERLGGQLLYNADVRRISVDGEARERGDAHPESGLEARISMLVSNADPSWTAPGRSAAPGVDGPKDRARQLLDEPLRLVFRDEQAVRRRLPSHDGAGAAIPGAAGRHLPQPCPGGRLQPLPPPADGERPLFGAGGCDACYVLAPVPNLASGTDWSERAEPYRAAIQKRLEETVMPGLGEAVVTSRMLTPQDFQDRLCSVNGAAFALEPRLFQSAWFRPHNLSQELPGLYLVGGGPHPGAGVPGVLSSAKVIDRLIPAASAFVK